MNDLARIYVKGGDGGDGKVSFRHEKFAPKGGPDGGDGGRGGDVVIVADLNVHNLVAFNFQKKYAAENGEHGMSKKMHGKDRTDTVIAVPVGTVIWELPEEMSEIDLRERANFEQVLAERHMLVDMETNGKKYIAAYGGKGGRGNDHFKSSVNQAPQEAEKGQKGEARWLLLELKMVADIGIVGLPNVGKSSLLKALTRANPKIAGYPFTTLEPNLGVASVGDKKLVLVDVPGVVEKAWEGKGIGPWFMRHLERVQMLVHVLAPDLEKLTANEAKAIAEQLIKDYWVVRREIEKYGQGLVDKKELVIVNKMELIEDKLRPEVAKIFSAEMGKDLIFVSAAMGEVGKLIACLS